MMSEPNVDQTERMERFLDQIIQFEAMNDFIDDSPIGRLHREFLQHNWNNARDGLLSKTAKFTVEPQPAGAPPLWPRVFKFQVDCPYKRKVGRSQPVELMSGPVRGTILYHPDLYRVEPGEHTVAVTLDRDLAFFHPNFSRQHQAVCLGEIPAGPFPLDALIEHVYGIVTYQNRTPTHPADVEAARYFALDPDAMVGLEPAEPLY